MEEPKQVQVMLKMPSYMVDAIAEVAARNHVEFADVVCGACVYTLELLLPGEWFFEPEKRASDGAKYVRFRRHAHSLL